MRWRQFRGSEAVEVATRLARELRLHRAPVDVRGVAAHLGIQILLGASGKRSTASRLEGGHATIWLSPEDAPVRQRFALAHHIGHLLLHRLEGERRDVSFTDGPEDIDANRFAMHLLMPSHVVQVHVDVYGADPRRLALDFCVTESFADLKLRLMAGCPG